MFDIVLNTIPSAIFPNGPPKSFLLNDLSYGPSFLDISTYLTDKVFTWFGGTNSQINLPKITF